MSSAGPISWCPIERIDELTRFVDMHWRQGHILARDADLVRWQYRNLADPTSLSVLIAEQDDQIVGILGLIQNDLNDHGRRHLGLVLATWVVIEAARRHAVGLRLLRRAIALLFQYVGVFGINQAATRIFDGLHFHVWDRVPRLARGFSPAALDDLLAAGGADYFAVAHDAWASTASFKLKTRSRNHFELRDWESCGDATWDRYWTGRAAPQQRGTWRDAAHLRWRYLRHPRFQYHVRVACRRGTDEVVGLLAYRLADVADRAERVLRVVEFLATEEAAQEFLAGEVCRVGEVEAVAFADFYCTSPGLVRGLEVAGFQREADMPAHLPSLFQPLDFRRSSLTAAAWVDRTLGDAGAGYFAGDDVYFTRSDGDQDRPN